MGGRETREGEHGKWRESIRREGSWRVGDNTPQHALEPASAPALADYPSATAGLEALGRQGRSLPLAVVGSGLGGDCVPPGGRGGASLQAGTVGVAHAKRTPQRGLPHRPAQQGGMWPLVRALAGRPLPHQEPACPPALLRGSPQTATMPPTLQLLQPLPGRLSSPMPVRRGSVPVWAGRVEGWSGQVVRGPPAPATARPHVHTALQGCPRRSPSSGLPCLPSHLAEQ